MPIDYERKGDLGYFTIREGTVNQITSAMHKELYDALQDFLADDQIRVGILQGAGNRAFSAGDDIKEPRPVFDTPMDFLSHELSDGPHKWYEEVQKLKRYKPIVAAVRGYCVGAGFAYLLHLTDIRVASEDAKFGFPEIAYGMAGAGGTTRLLRHLPPALAMEILLTGDPLDAQRALSVHLVNAVVPSEKVLEEAERFALRIARHPPLGVRIEMESTLGGMDLNARESFDFTLALMRLRRLAAGGSREVGQFLYKRNGSDAA